MKYFILGLCLAVISCQSTSDQDSSKEVKQEIASFEKVDSLVFSDILARIFLFQAADEEHFVFRDIGSSEIYIFDREGVLFQKFSKAGDVPGAFSIASENLDLSPSGNFTLVDPMGGIKVISKNGESLKNIPLKETQVSMGGLFSLFRKSQVFEMEGREHFLYSLDINVPYQERYDAEFLNQRKNLILVDLESNDQTLLLPFPDQSKFLNGKVYPFADFRPRFYLDENLGELYLMFQNESILFTYDWNQGNPKLKDSIELKLNGFEGNIGWEEGSITLGEISSPKATPFSSSIQSLEKIGDDFLISYKPLPTSTDLITKVKEGNASDEDKAKLWEERALKTVLLKANGVMLEVDTPEFYYDSYRVIGNEIYWMKKPDPNVEAEEFVLYWGKLKLN
jgi:hypothetical protein